jgi:hypothetical protein
MKEFFKNLFSKKNKLPIDKTRSFELVYIEDNNSENNMHVVFGISEERKEELVKLVIQTYEGFTEKSNLIDVFKTVSKSALHQNELCFLIAVATVHHEQQKRNNNPLNLLNELFKDL